MANLTAAQVTSLNGMCFPANSALLGSAISALQTAPAAGGATVAVGTLKTMYPQHYQIAPALNAATTVHAAITLTASTQTVTTAITNPDVPRNCTVKGNASGITGNVVITGTDIAGATVTDTIALNGSTEVAGVVAFKSVTQVALPVQTHGGTDTVSVGCGILIGLTHILFDATAMLIHNFNASTDSGTTTIDAALSKNVYSVAGTMDGAKKVDLVYLA